MSEQLKPCPFCGGDARLVDEYGDGEWWWVECTARQCKGRTQADSGECGRDAIVAAWNRRAPSLPAIVAALEAERANWDAKYPSKTAFDGGYLSALQKAIDIVKELSK